MTFEDFKEVFNKHCRYCNNLCNDDTIEINEANTRDHFIKVFLENVLEYAIRDPREYSSEYTVLNVDNNEIGKADMVILKKGEPLKIIEAKSLGREVNDVILC